MTQGEDGETDKPRVTASATRPVNEWGIPDWRDPAAYGDVKGWTFERWRWEFHRRRDDLREYFDARADETYQNWQQRAGKPSFSIADKRPDEPGFCAIVDVKDWRQFGYASLPNPRISDQPAEVLWPVVYDDCVVDYIEGDRIGAHGYRGTFGEILKMYEVTLTERDKLKLEEILECFPVALEPHEIALTFDSNKPIAGQLKDASDRLKQHQSKLHGKKLQKRQQPKLWLLYIRALDARESGATWNEMADTFYSQKLLDRHKDPQGGYGPPPPQAARDRWNAADVLRFNF
jgi:hypothetical protein